MPAAVCIKSNCSPRPVLNTFGNVKTVSKNHAIVYPYIQTCLTNVQKISFSSSRTIKLKESFCYHSLRYQEVLYLIGRVRMTLGLSIFGFNAFDVVMIYIIRTTIASFITFFPYWKHMTKTR